MARILIVDDSEVELVHMVRIIEALGHQALVARSGEEGVLVATQKQPDVIVMDVVMPGVNGFQATRQIKHSVETRHIPIIMVSVKDQPVDIAWGQRQGADSYLIKPVLARELMPVVDALLEASPGTKNRSA